MEGYFVEQIKYLYEQRDLIGKQIKDLTTKEDALYDAITALRQASDLVEDGEGLHSEG